MFRSVLHEVCEKYLNRVYVVLDGVNECPPEERQKLNRYLQELYRFGLRLYITTTEEKRNEIRDELGKVDLYTEAEIEANESDLKRFIRNRLSQNHIKPEGPVVDAITERASSSYCSEFFCLF